MRLLKVLCGLLLVLYLAGGCLLYIYQRDVMYFPTPQLNHDFEIEQFSSGDVRVDVVVLNRGKMNAIIYFGGNGEQVVHNAHDFEAIFGDYTIYLVNYRGYGGSTGFPTENGIYSDAHKIYDSIAKQYNSVSVIGRSLGTGVSTYLASTRDISKMVLITPYDSILNVAKNKYPIYPISILLKDKYISVSRVQDIKSSVLILVAGHDAVVPSENSEALIGAFPPSQIRVEKFKGAGHNSISNDSRYYPLLVDFFKSANKASLKEPESIGSESIGSESLIF
jgi:pimeloyl-ACP methyl ester carboxylesterase